MYDEALRIEAYHFKGIMQPFPNHFHEYYVIGLVEEGERCLSCRNQEYHLRKGDVVLFQPGDNHACVQSDGGTFDYRGFNLTGEVMQDLMREITGSCELPGFSRNVIHKEEISTYVYRLNEMVMIGADAMEKEETLFVLLSELIRQYGQPLEKDDLSEQAEVEQACSFIEQHFAEHISLDQICYKLGISKSSLLRAFVRKKGITPYRYLENIRIGKARKLLEQGVQPVEAALRTGFSDQSHFTNYFSSFIGLAPGSYREIFSEKRKDGREVHEE